jgi:hypothetical protein
MPTPAKKAASSTRKSPSVSPEPDVSDFAKDVTIDVLLKKAFPHGAYAHIPEWIENQNLAPEVRAELEAAVARNA